MMSRVLTVLPLTVLLLLVGCTAAPEPAPTSPAPSASPTLTPPPEAVAPDIAFDLSCAEIAEEMTALTGELSGEVREHLTVDSAPAWYPGPAQYMFSRAGGVACAGTGADGASWEITITPWADAVITGATARDGFDHPTRCEEGGFCHISLQEGDLLVDGTVNSPALTGDAEAKVDAVVKSIAARAAGTYRSVEIRESDLVGKGCLQILPEGELSEALGQETAFRSGGFGGWGVPAEVYHVVNGSVLCSYGADADPYSETYLTITTLPAGAWAFDLVEGRMPIGVAHADTAMIGAEDPYRRPYLDLLINGDWLRLTGTETGDIDVLPAVAERIVEHLTVPTPAPQ